VLKGLIDLEGKITCPKLEPKRKLTKNIDPHMLVEFYMSYITKA
jgi:hypothetical protein